MLSLQFCFFLSVLLCLSVTVSSLQVAGSTALGTSDKRRLHSRSELGFKKNEGGDDMDVSKWAGSVWKGIKRFLPNTSKARLVETYKEPLSDAGNRYHVRLVDASVSKKRHIITRLRRYLPDLSWASAESIVDTAIDEGASLIRVLNSKSEVEYLVDMLRKADPPIAVQVYDTRTDEVLAL